MVTPGELFAGKYRIERELGKGGMGVVLLATHEQLREKVAIKALLPDSARDAETLERFRREAQASMKIKSEHVGRVFDYGVDAERPYIVMEYLDGQDVARVLRDRGPLPVGLAVDWVLQALEAVAEAHARKIIHRDLKPSNLFLVKGIDGEDVIKVLDFGISKFTQDDGVDLVATKTSVLLGSPLYMSPEQLRSSKSVTPQSDIWSVGVILYELVAGVVPFNATSLPELGALVLGGPTPWLNKAAPACSFEFAQVVATCMAKDPADRYASVLDLANALAPFASGATPSLEKISLYLDHGVSPPVAAASAPPPAQRTERMPSALAVNAPPPRSRGTAPIVAALVVVGLGFASWKIAQGRRTVAAHEHVPAASAAPVPMPVATTWVEPAVSVAVAAEPALSTPPAVSHAPRVDAGVRKSAPQSSAAQAAPKAAPSSEFASSRTGE